MVSIQRNKKKKIKNKKKNTRWNAGTSRLEYIPSGLLFFGHLQMGMRRTFAARDLAGRKISKRYESYSYIDFNSLSLISVIYASMISVMIYP